jgi:hypothetical protein
MAIHTGCGRALFEARWNGSKNGPVGNCLAVTRWRPQVGQDSSNPRLRAWHTQNDRLPGLKFMRTLVRNSVPQAE